ncbi:MAG: hypothetical protein LJF30_12725 [Acidobacteria bacterium]|nr:hypothetical protein [Acidobacteriota bacterium]
MILLTGSMLVLAAGGAWAGTYRVGPGRPYATLQDVVNLLGPGDVVEVDGDHTYPGGVSFRRPGAAGNPIVIRGTTTNGRRPIISGGDNTVEFVSYEGGGDHYVFENFEVTGGARRCVYHQSDDLTLRYLKVHDCPQQGILGADSGSGSLTLEFSEIYNCGSGTQNHQIYMSADQEAYPDSVFRMQYNWVHDGTGGNNVKSRAARNEIYYNRLEGAYYHELELIGSETSSPGAAREDGDVVGNLIIRKGSNGNWFVTRLGGDGTGESNGRYRFVNNTIIVPGSSPIFRIFDGIESLEVHNNVFFRTGGGSVTMERTVEANWLNGRQVAGSNNWVPIGTTIPEGWIQTVTEANPGFSNAGGDDFTLDAESSLADAGAPSPAPPGGFAEIPKPLDTPAFVPPGPPHPLEAATARPTVGVIDIGAYEFVAATPAPAISISDPTAIEGDAGSVELTFTLTLTDPD